MPIPATPRAPRVIMELNIDEACRVARTLTAALPEMLRRYTDLRHDVRLLHDWSQSCDLLARLAHQIDMATYDAIKEDK